MQSLYSLTHSKTQVEHKKNQNLDVDSLTDYYERELNIIEDVMGQYFHETDTVDATLSPTANTSHDDTHTHTQTRMSRNHARTNTDWL